MLTVGVVALLQAEYTLFCLEHLVASTLYQQNQLQIIIVLNGASQEVVTAVRDFESNHARTFVIQNPLNVGYAEACNQILKQTSTKYVCFIHNDVLVSSRCLEVLTLQAETTSKEAVAFIPLTNYANEHFCCVREIREAFARVKPPNKSKITKQNLVEGLKSLYGDFEEFAKGIEIENHKEPLLLCQEMTSFCCLFKANELKKLGGFDNRFHLRGYEDKELWLRIQQQQFQVVLCRIAFAHHHGNLTTDGEGFSYPELVESQSQVYARIFEQTKLLKKVGPFTPRPLISSLSPQFQHSIQGLNTKPKRLLYFGSHYMPENAGGAELSAHETHRILLKYGVEICAVCIRNRFHKKFETFRSFDYEGVKVFQVPEMNGNDVRAKLITIIEQFQPQAVITHSIYAALALKVLATDYPKIKRIFFFRHQTDILDGMLGSVLKEDGGTELVSNSIWMQGVLRSQTGRDSALIYPVVTPKSCFLPPREKKREAIVIGNGVLSKGIKEFISIAEALPDYPFQVWGSLDPKIAPHMLPQNIAVKNWTQDLRTIYREAKVVLNLSVDPEPFGRTLIEAFYNHIPIIAHNEGGPKEFVKHGGVLVSNTEEVVRAIERMYSDRVYYQTLCEGTQIDLSFYNPYRENAKLVEVFLRALGEGSLKGYTF